MENLSSKHNERILAEAVKAAFSAGQTDYGLEPIVLSDCEGKALGRIENGDSVVFCCRRGEREIQLTEAFTDPMFVQRHPDDVNDLNFVILTLYHDKFKDLPVAFAPSKVQQTLGEIVSNSHHNQLRISESEKFAHVTFFLNGGQNQPFPGETDIRIPSIKGISFDQVPQLKLREVSDEVIKGMNVGYDLIITNFANGDVIGHTQNSQAKIKCAAVVDENLGKVLEAAKLANYLVFITADHGNLEVLMTEDGSPHVSHTSNLVRFLVVDPQKNSQIHLRDGQLSDIAPTILNVLGEKPSELMTGSVLTGNHDFGNQRKVLLIILDGWGLGKEDDSNPIFIADTPVWDDLMTNYPGCDLRASGEAVGLKSGKPGNSEAGHMNIGAGRVVLQDDVRLDLAMKDGSFYTNEVLCKSIELAKEKGRKLHLIGLLTEKSSHGSIDYPLAILKMAKERGLDEVFLHMILDGRSTEPGSAPYLLELLDQKMQEIGIGEIVSVIGRGIALDRDGNYQKTRKAYDAFVSGLGSKCVKVAD